MKKANHLFMVYVLFQHSHMTVRRYADIIELWPSYDGYTLFCQFEGMLKGNNTLRVDISECLP